MARFPTLSVGQRFTADLASSMLPDFYNKTGPTSRISNATRTNDPDLVAPVLANALYEVVINLVVTGAAAADFSMGFVAPAASTFTWTLSSQGSTSGLYTGDIAFAGALGTTITIGTDPALTTGTPVVVIGNLNTDVTAGNFALQWAQGVSTASNTTILGDSYMKLTRMA